ncbi:MAG: hypothetical protein ACM3X6_14125 [Patescibacteria group bacterium]
MANREQIQQCIDQCTQAAMTLRSAANNIVNASARKAATSGANQIEQCISECLQAKNIT